jgi:hypothetical protein
VIAHNALGQSIGETRTFTTQGAATHALPDGRAWQLVSPANKHGASLEAIPLEGGMIEAADDGSALAFIAKGPILEGPAGSRSSMNSQLLARRSGSGSWSTTDITTPHKAPAGAGAVGPSEYRLFSNDLSRAIVEPEGATPLSPKASERTPYRREVDGQYTPLVTAANVAAGTKFGGKEGEPELFGQGVNFVTGTPDLTHVLLTSPSSLVEGYESAGELSLYEWGEGELSAVSVLPNGNAASEEGVANVGNADYQVRGAISADGNRAFFSAPARHRLYVRDMAKGETLRIDKAEAGLKEAEGGATFQIASEDGNTVLFSDGARLTKDATAKPGQRDLYQCRIVLEANKLACQLKDLSVDTHPGEAADVQETVLGAGEEGRYVYFAAKGALEDGAVSNGSCPRASEGQCVNLYVFDTRTGQRRLVAVLAEADSPDWSVAQGRPNLGRVTSRVSPNGRYLAFMSERPLTGYDNRDAHNDARDEEAFLYDFASGGVRCVSCEASGQRPAGVFDPGGFPGLLVDRPGLWTHHWLAGSIPGWTRVDLFHALHQSRYLSNSGRLFFNSPLALAPGDSNGSEDVYQYEPAGVGSCSEEGGCVGLVSSGSSSEESAFLEASETGDDVFFMTAAQLARADSDSGLDVYDAHVCSLAPGCPAESLDEVPPCVSADACRAAPSPQPRSFGAPASQTFSGAGNPPAPSKPKAKPLTRARKLAKALAACKKKPKRARPGCQREAHRRYGPQKAKARKNSSKSKKGRGK